MLKNYLKIALRNIVSQKIFSVINILGLSVGFACCLLIALFVIDEFSYDKSYSQAERIYRVSRYFNAINDNPVMAGPANAPQVAPLLKDNYPAVEEAGRIIDEEVLVSFGESAFYEAGFRLADNNFLRIFDFEWIQGDPATALIDPFTVVITESTSKKYFADADPVGQTLLIENSAPMQVVGVIRDLPKNTHLTADIIGSLSSIPRIYGEEELQRWGSNNYHTYILLREGENITDLEKQFPDFFNRFYQEGSSERTGMTATKLTDIHLRGGASPFSTPGNINTVYAFIAIAVCILLIGSINFMNLSTARASKRAKEVGMRVSLGADRLQIIRQFLGESLLFAVLGMILALVLVEMLLPWFNSFVDKTLSLNYFATPEIAIELVSIVMLVGVLAGSYPAFYISAFRPAKTLKGDMSRSQSGLLFRNILVVLQFAISIVLVISTSVVFSQMRFAKNIELGFEKDRVVILTGSPTERLGAQWRTIRDRLLEHPGISHVTASKRLPGEQNLDATGFRFEGRGQPISMPFNPVDFGFFDTYQVDLLAGRTFNENIVSDQLAPPVEGGPVSQGAFVINSAAARVNGWSAEEAIGKSVEFAGNAGAVIGVIEDVYFESLHNQIRPMVYFLTPAQGPDAIRARAASIKINSGSNTAETLAYIDAVWNEYMPAFPVARRFLNSDFEVLYRNEQKQGEILGYFSLLAIMIACFGLYGLASLNAEQRTKEIGVRKVMGGSVWSIVVLLTNDFSKLVLIANLIA